MKLDYAKQKLKEKIAKSDAKKKALRLSDGAAGAAARSKLKEKNAKGDAKRKALRLSDGAAGAAARSKKKKENARSNAKVKDRTRAMAEARMLQILPVQEISNTSAIILACTNIIPGLAGTLEELMHGSKAMIYIWLSGRALQRHAGMGSKEDKELKDGQVWYVNITYMILGEVGDEITMDKHQSKTLGKEVERIKTIRVNEGQKMKMLKVIH